MSQNNIDGHIVEVLNDYSAINKYVSHTLDRQLDLLEFRKAQRTKQFLLGLSIFVSALGLASLLFFYGYSLKSKPAQSIKEVITSVESKQVSNLDTVDEIERIKIEYTVFKYVTLKNGESVVTGLIYQPRSPDFPESQYCYHSVFTGDGKRLMVDLARKEGINNVLWFDKITDKHRALAKTHCQFMNKP